MFEYFVKASRLFVCGCGCGILFQVGFGREGRGFESGFGREGRGFESGSWFGGGGGGCFLKWSFVGGWGWFYFDFLGDYFY